jgi:hypothetical protein
VYTGLFYLRKNKWRKLLILPLLCKDRVRGTKNVECNDHSEQSARSHYRVKFCDGKPQTGLEKVPSACCYNVALT